MMSQRRQPVFPRPSRRIGAQPLRFFTIKTPVAQSLGQCEGFGMSVFINRRDRARGLTRLPDGPDQMPDHLRKAMRRTAWHERRALAPLIVGWRHRQLILSGLL